MAQGPAATLFWRVLAISLSLVAGGVAAALFLNYSGWNGIGALDPPRAALVAFATAWIAWGAAQALIGLLPWRPRPAAVPHDLSQVGRTAILVPVYNEDPEAIFARIAAMDDELTSAGLRPHFDIAILSDTTDMAIQANERAALPGLLAVTGGQGRLFYRHRQRNTGRKSGNIEDFVRKSGGAYEFALILDADSLMDARTIETMVRRIAADPKLGLLQSLPTIVNARSRFGRAMQFSAAFYAPVFARGLARLQGRTGPFWGHNAIVRVTAFAESCGLPELDGPPPFGGHILSHDYVEAALLARAGWHVRVDTDMGGSFEEGPEGLIAFAKRDRRWCQGNLQHARLLGAPGLMGWSRFVFAQGIMAYIAPILWGLFIATSVLDAAIAPPPDYFPVPEFSVPIFPGERTAAAVGLLIGVFGLLLLPKLMIAVQAGVTGRARGFGGAAKAFAGVLAEIVLTSVLAPILMMFQARSVAQILAGRDGGWPASNRDDGEVEPEEAWAACWWMSVTGALLLVLAAWLAPQLVPWLCPVALPLAVAPLLVVWSSRESNGPLFVTPSEQCPPPVVAAYRARRAPAKAIAAAA